MNREVTVFCCVLIINAICVFIYWIFSLFMRRKRPDSYLLRCAVMLLAPIIGIVIFFFSFVFRHTIFRKINVPEDPFSKERSKFYMKSDENKESNYVPLEEALAVSDSTSTRHLMMDIARGDAASSLGAIANALNSEDSEVSHYAATVLQDVLEKIKMDFQTRFLQIKDPKDDEESKEKRYEIADDLLFDLNDVLLQKVLTAPEEISYTDMMEQVAEILDDGRENEGGNIITSEQLEAITLRQFDIKNYDICNKWCDRAGELYPNAASTFTSKLKLYFYTGEREKFLDTMDRLKKSGVSIDHDTLEIIRAFM